MQQQRSNHLATIDSLSFPEYLQVLGLQPIAIRPGESDYKSPLGKDDRSILTVYHDSNRFEDKGTRLRGTLSDFVGHLFGSSPDEICADVVRHRLYLVKTKIAALP